MQENKTASFFNGYSGDFNAIYGSGTGTFQRLINKWFRQTMLIRFQKTIAACNPLAGKSILDVGCGPGLYAITLAKGSPDFVYGIDFAPAMIELAQKEAKKAGVEKICRFAVADFTTLPEDKQYSYLILMGFMDYIKNPESVIDKAMHLANEKVLFSFPSDKGFLAWQRKIRYKFKCPLYLYNEKQLHQLFAHISPWQCKIENIGRDFFVTLEKQEK
ncbi:MAG TPA: class I SAM-dependent methyltransferase [Candidatus Cloacimonas sp.]|mgnify:FL=1|nr:class I SAM-dependent methyltransferase [Candidatus Cloacimonas sp.]